MTQFYLRAKVVECTRTLIKLDELEPEVRDNHRRNFRLAVNTPISIYYYNDERMERPEQCLLVDISTEGCCIQSEYLHGGGEVLRLEVKLDEYVAMNFVGEVIRVSDCGANGFRCGILFAQLKKDEVESLTKMLFNIQLGNRREHVRSEQGYWTSGKTQKGTLRRGAVGAPLFLRVSIGWPPPPRRRRSRPAAGAGPG